jgi:hypothetical protein
MQPVSPDVRHVSGFLSDEECTQLQEFLLGPCHPWYHVRYHHERNPTVECATPCLTNFFCTAYHGGIPEVLQTVARKLETACGLREGYFNVVSTRLYRSGADHIAQHTDNRSFLDQEHMAIAQVCLGPAVRRFVMQRACGRLASRTDDNDDDGDKFDMHSTHTYVLRHGDMLAMLGVQTQRAWTHGVPSVVAADAPVEQRQAWRLVVNYRRVHPTYFEQGARSFYRYCVFGDDIKDEVHLWEHNAARKQDDETVFPARSERFVGADVIRPLPHQKRQQSLLRWMR